MGPWHMSTGSREAEVVSNPLLHALSLLGELSNLVIRP